MKVFFRKLFNIYPGEEKNSFLFAFLGFLWALGVTSGQKFSDVLFLLHVGPDSLPTAYTWAACALIVISSVLLYAFHVISSHRIFLCAIFAGICFYTFTYFCQISNLGTETKWLWFALRIFGTVFFSVMMTCYWTFIDQYHHLQDAKRLYSLFSSMIFLGIAATGLIMRSGLIEFQHLTLIIIFLLIMTAGWIKKIVKEISPVHDEHEQEGSIGFHVGSLRLLIKSILTSRFTLLLMVGNFLIYLLLVITEYNYLASFDHHFDVGHSGVQGGEEKAKLTLFLGQCLAGVSITNLIIGLFIYSRLVRRFGITSLMLFTPTLLLFTFSGWQFSHSLIFPVMGLFVVEGTLYVIDDSNFNLLLNAVPSKVKYKIRVIIESFFEPIGMLTSAMLLSFSQIDSKKLGLVLAAFSLVVALLLRRRYLKAIYLNLAENAIHFQRTIHEWFSGLPRKEQNSLEYRLLAIMKKGDEQAQILAIEGLVGCEDKDILEKMLKLASHLHDSVKIKFLDFMGQSSYAHDPLLLDMLHQWSDHETNPDIMSAIDLFLAKQGLLNHEKALKDIKSSDVALKAAGIISLMKSGHDNVLASQELQQLLHSALEEEICLGLVILGTSSSSQNIEILLPFLSHPSTKAVRIAAASIAQIAEANSAIHGPALISQLNVISDNETRLSLLKALGKMEDISTINAIIGASIHFRPNERRLTESIIFDMGMPAVPILLAITKDTSLHDRCRVLSGRILGRLALPQLRENLYDIINIEIERAYFYFFHYHKIQTLYPEIDLKTLEDALLTGYHSVLDFIIQLLGTAGELEDCELLSRSIRSRNPKIRSQVVEALEKTCEPKIFRVLQPLVSDLPIEEKIRAYLKEGHKPLSLTELLDRMAHSSGQVDQIIAAALCHKLNMPNWRETLKKQLSSNEEIFHHFAYELLQS